MLVAMVNGNYISNMVASYIVNIDVELSPKIPKKKGSGHPILKMFYVECASVHGRYFFYIFFNSFMSD